MDLRFNHDEHQFIASGVLLAQAGLLPYRDYPHFHMPNLVFVNALLFRLTDYYLLAARTLSVLSGWLLLVALYFTALRLFRNTANRARFLIGAGMVLLLGASPMLVYTSGRAWNHDLPAVLSMAAFLLLVYGLKRPPSLLWLASEWLSGRLRCLHPADSDLAGCAPLFGHLALAQSGVPASAPVGWAGLCRRRAVGELAGNLFFGLRPRQIPLWESGICLAEHPVSGHRRLCIAHDPARQAGLFRFRCAAQAAGQSAGGAGLSALGVALAEAWRAWARGAAADWGSARCSRGRRVGAHTQLAPVLFHSLPVFRRRCPLWAAVCAQLVADTALVSGCQPGRGGAGHGFGGQRPPRSRHSGGASQVAARLLARHRAEDRRTGRCQTRRV